MLVESTSGMNSRKTTTYRMRHKVSVDFLYYEVKALHTPCPPPAAMELPEEVEDLATQSQIQNRYSSVQDQQVFIPTITIQPPSQIHILVQRGIA